MRDIVPDLLVVAVTARVGTVLGYPDTRLHLQDLEPVFVGDTIVCRETITQKDEKERYFTVTVSCAKEGGAEVLQAVLRGHASRSDSQGG